MYKCIVILDVKDYLLEILPHLAINDGQFGIWIG